MFFLVLQSSVQDHGATHWVFSVVLIVCADALVVWQTVRLFPRIAHLFLHTTKYPQTWGYFFSIRWDFILHY